MFLLPREFHEDGDGGNDQEVKDHELVHLLPDVSLPALQDNGTHSFRDAWTDTQHTCVCVCDVQGSSHGCSRRDSLNFYRT